MASLTSSVACTHTPMPRLSASHFQAPRRIRIATATTTAEMKAGAAQLASARVMKPNPPTSASGGIAKGSISRAARLIAGGSEEDTAELQSQAKLVCRLLLGKKK